MASASPNPPLPSRTTNWSPRSIWQPRSHNRCTSTSHSVWSSLRASCQSRTSRLPSSQKPKATSTTIAGPTALMPLPLAGIWLDLLLLTLDSHPDPVQLDHWGNVSQRSSMHSTGQSFHLIDAFIERPQAHTPLYRGAPLVL